ncbi:hypothetical protein BLA29_012471 [Euroglyphus maynei]|uniref:Uncharacterized protein n=1 Tax=Euroglyphus maynei TaxID=6958 RepID=A0A1Y3ASS3_EURMA|nr:hypothetical protein BLA29_012471 [Euroglyphus maynei]
MIKDRRISSRFDVDVRKIPPTKIPILNNRHLDENENENDDKCKLDQHKQQSNGNGVILKSEISTPIQNHQQPTIEHEPKQQQQQQKTKLGSKFFDLIPKTKVQV